MNSIIQARPASLALAVKVDGKAFPIPANATVTAQLYNEFGTEPLFDSVTLVSTTVGADWPNGVVGLLIDDGTTGSLPQPAIMVLVVVNGMPKRFRITVMALDDAPEHSDLFVKDFVVDEMRNDRLVLMSQTYFSGVTMTDNFIWEKIVAAESELKHTLRVPLVPTAFFPSAPTADELTALNGMPWAIDPAYDYGHHFYDGEKWGFIVLRNKPIVSITSVRLFYPSPMPGIFEFPADWLRIDQKYAHLRFVPSTNSFIAPMTAFVMQTMASGRMLPQAIDVRYVAGINAKTDYPEVIDIIKKMAVLKIIKDGFIPQSGSISADGLSQSMSMDMSKYEDSIDVALNGPKGTNGGLMTAIHGIRSIALG